VLAPISRSSILFFTYAKSAIWMTNEIRCTKAAKKEAIMARSMTKRFVESDKQRAMMVTPVAAKRVNHIALRKRVLVLLTNGLDCESTRP
jgi:hypothetical protein